MVDITRCEKCGKVIPALETGCAWCDAEEAGQAGFREDDWIPLSIRMLLWMFLVNLAGTALLAVVALAASATPLVQLLAVVRLVLALSTLVAVLVRHPLATALPFAFLGFEAMCFVAASAGWLSGVGWIGSWIAPLWNLLFGFLFVRDDVRARLDRRSADRDAVGRLLDEFVRRDD